MLNHHTRIIGYLAATLIICFCVVSFLRKRYESNEKQAHVASINKMIHSLEGMQAPPTVKVTLSIEGNPSTLTASPGDEVHVVTDASWKILKIDHYFQGSPNPITLTPKE